MRDVRTGRLELKHQYDLDGLQTFISDLLKRNDVVKLHIDTPQRLILPDSLFHSSSLKELVLIKGPPFIIPSTYSFLNLTSLCLHDVVISNVDVGDEEELVFNCPVLENLEVSRCSWHGGGF